MESESHDIPSRPVDPHRAMASRIRSAPWVHGTRGLLIAAAVFGLAGRPTAAAWLLPLSAIGLVVLSRWRTQSIGISRANTERWRFVAAGAPWAVVMLAVAVAAMAFVVVARDVPLWQPTLAAAVAGVVTATLGPAADQAVRRRMVRDPAGGAAG